jgi:hypothetical protein
MSHDVGVWIDHKKAVIVSASGGHVTLKTLESDVAAHPRFGGRHDDGGEKNYEERHRQSLERYYDDVINHLGKPEALLIFGPGEAKLELKERLGRSDPSQPIIEIETAYRLSDPQIMAKVKDHFATTVFRDGSAVDRVK